jgi:hypothetical protein
MVEAEASKGQTTINYEAVAIAGETVVMAEMVAAVAVAAAMMATAAMVAAMRQPWQWWRWCQLCLAEESVIFNCTANAWGDSTGFAGASDTRLASL